MLENLFSYVLHSTLVGKSIFLLLLILSIYSWSVILFKWISMSRTERTIRKGIRLFEEQKNLNAGLQAIGEMPTSVLASISEEAILEINRLKRTSCSATTAITTITRVLQNTTALELSIIKKGLSSLATIGNAAPFIGLFGTVWGIINTFSLIGTVKNASFAVVAPSLGEALFVTALGIAVAIPSSVAFNIFQTYAQRISTLLSVYCSILLNAIQRELIVANVKKNTQEKGV